MVLSISQIILRRRRLLPLFNASQNEKEKEVNRLIVITKQ